MYYYAFINEQKICTGTYSFPSKVELPNYIYLGEIDDKTVIGKRYNEVTGKWEEVVNYFYAQLNEKDICISVTELPSEVSDPKFIRIPSLDQTLLGKWYDRSDNTFKDVPVHILADHSSSVVNYKDTDRWLDEVIEGKAEKAEVYTKTESENKFALKNEASGVNGKSAYEVAVANGFVGTEKEWLASLKGADGKDGVPGKDGAPGVKGEPFVYADFTPEQLAALKGTKGDKGDPGERGLPGRDGVDGRNGIDGAKGDKGDPGADGKDFNGNLPGNVLRVNGQQTIFDSGSMITLSTNNRETMIAGSKIYSKSAIQVSSDKRLKENIKAVNVTDLANFISKLQIVNYAYKGNAKKHIGVIAQQMIKADADIAEAFVDVDGEGYLTVSFSELVFPLIAAVQALQDRVAELEAK